jgi:hypothetical protein
MLYTLSIKETVTRGVFTPRPLLRLKHIIRAAPSLIP